MPGGGPALVPGRGHGTIIHYRDEPDDGEVQGKGLTPLGGEDH